MWWSRRVPANGVSKLDVLISLVHANQGGDQPTWLVPTRLRSRPISEFAHGSLAFRFAFTTRAIRKRISLR